MKKDTPTAPKGGKQPKETNALANVAASYIPLDQIYGVDIENGDYTPHADFTNPKDVRDGVLDALAAAKGAGEIPAIEIAVHPSDDSIVVIDGTHRVLNAVEHCYNQHKEGKDWTKSAFARIKVDRINGTIEELQFRAFRANIEDGRSQLTDKELAVGVERFMLLYGLTAKEVCKRLKVSDEKYIAQFEAILKASPAVADAVKRGKVSAKVGADIAKLPIHKQRKAAEAAEAAIAEGKGEREVREAAGTKRDRTRVRNMKEWTERAFSGGEAAIWPTIKQAHADGELVEEDSEIRRLFDLLVWVFCLDELGVKSTLKARVAWFDAAYSAFADAEEAKLRKATEAKDKKRTSEDKKAGKARTGGKAAAKKETAATATKPRKPKVDPDEEEAPVVRRGLARATPKIEVDPDEAENAPDPDDYDADPSDAPDPDDYVDDNE